MTHSFKRAVIVVLATMLLVQSSPSYAAGGVRGVLERLYNFIDSPIGGIVVGEAIDLGKQAWTNSQREATKRQLEKIANDSGQYAPFVRSLIPNINPDTTPYAFNAMVKESIATISRLDAADAAMEAKIANLQKRQGAAESDIYFNKRRIEAIERLQKEYKAEFDRAIDSLDRRVGALGVRLDLETLERQQADQTLSGRIDDIARVVLPETRRTTAAKLGSDGAMILLANGNTNDAIGMLRLSMAYDKHSQKHLDPGCRYWLAMAYHRAGMVVPAEEMLSEAVVAERLRHVPEWHGRVVEKFQTKERCWMEAGRQERRFGVQAQRDVISLDVEKANPTTPTPPAADAVSNGK